MSEHDNLIVRVRQQEDEASKMLQQVEKENNQRIAAASESADQLVLDTEQTVKEAGMERFQQSKEKGKEEYKTILVEADNRRRDAIETGKVQITKAKKFVHDNFQALFDTTAS